MYKRNLVIYINKFRFFVWLLDRSYFAVTPGDYFSLLMWGEPSVKMRWYYSSNSSGLWIQKWLKHFGFWVISSTWKKCWGLSCLVEESVNILSALVNKVSVKWIIGMFQLVWLFEGLEIKAEDTLKGIGLGSSQGQSKFSIINLI